MCEWNGSTYEVCEQNIEGICPSIRQEVSSKVRPYLVDAFVHFLFFCLTLVLIFSMSCFLFLVLCLYRFLFHEVPIIIEIIVYFSDILIFIHFAAQFIKLPSTMSCQLLIAKYAALRSALNRL